MGLRKLCLQVQDRYACLPTLRYYPHANPCHYQTVSILYITFPSSLQWCSTAPPPLHNTPVAQVNLCLIAQLLGGLGGKYRASQFQDQTMHKTIFNR